MSAVDCCSQPLLLEDLTRNLLEGRNLKTDSTGRVKARFCMQYVVKLVGIPSKVCASSSLELLRCCTFTYFDVQSYKWLSKILIFHDDLQMRM